ncbi:MAG: hypothetical protein K9G26_05500 [Emcibacter sp.]|nr:hypothetical protein [Emcibacter sp.]
MINILVPEAHTRANIAAIRSLGRAGYSVHACSYQKNALGLKSNYVTYAVIQPDYSAPEYLDWLEDYIRHHDIKMIVPTGNFLNSIRSHFEKFKHLLPVSQNPDILYKFFGKTDIVDCYQKAPSELHLMDHHPDSVIIDIKNDDVKIPKETPFGYFVKFEDRVENVSDEENIPELNFAKNPAEVREIIDNARHVWQTALIQSGCTGRQVGVSILMDKGEALAVSCVRDVHLKPHSKGTMSLRETCWYEDIVSDAIKRLRFLDWQGCAMVEYRREENGNFTLIEINARYWQYLHLDIKSGVDFPKYQAEWFLEGKKEFTYRPILGTKSRDTWPGEVAWATNELRDSSNAGLRKLRVIEKFIAGFILYDDDFNFTGDRKLYFYNFLKYIKSEFTALIHKTHVG